jgi:hypothetical protein
MNCKHCMLKDCTIFLRDVNKIVTLLEELKPKLESKIQNGRLTRRHIAIIALKYAKSEVSSHLESSIEIRDQLTSLLECLQGGNCSILTMVILRSFYKNHIKEFRTTYNTFKSMLR